MPFLTCFLLYHTFSKNAISYTVKKNDRQRNLTTRRLCLSFLNIMFPLYTPPLCLVNAFFKFVLITQKSVTKNVRQHSFLSKKQILFFACNKSSNMLYYGYVRQFGGGLASAPTEYRPRLHFSIKVIPIYRLSVNKIKRRYAE